MMNPSFKYFIQKLSLFFADLGCVCMRGGGRGVGRGSGPARKCPSLVNI